MSTQISPLAQLAQLLQTDPLPELEQPGCNFDPENLVIFVSDELAGLPVDELYPKTARHLDLCTRCMQDYCELSRLSANSLYPLE